MFVEDWCPSYKQSNKGIRERKGPTVDVLLIENSVKRVDCAKDRRKATSLEKSWHGNEKIISRIMRTALGDQSLILSSSSRGSRGGYDWNAWNLWGRRRMIRCTQHFQHLDPHVTWLHWQNEVIWRFHDTVSFLCPRGRSCYCRSPVRVNSDKRHGLWTATMEQKWWQATATEKSETSTVKYRQRYGFLLNTWNNGF